MNTEVALQFNPCLKPGERQSASVFQSRAVDGHTAEK